MGITLFTFGGLLAPLQQIIGWVAAAPARARSRRRSLAHPVPAASRAGGRGHFYRPATACAATLPLRRPLRVVRVVEACQSSAGAGRMVISGRMADVCAELDRLASLEAQGAR